MTVTFSDIGNYGRLGNQLFQIATVIATAKKYNADYLIPIPIPNLEQGSRRLLGYNHNIYFGEKFDFKVVNRDWIKKYPKKFTYHYEQSQYKEIDLSGGIEHDPHCIYDLIGYFQSEKYFKNAETEVRELFSLERYRAESLDALDKIKWEEKTGFVVGVGIRLTDYLQVEDFYHNLSKTNYYKRGFEYFHNRYKCTFLIFSDDIHLAKQKIKEMGLDGKYSILYEANDRSDDVDSFALMSCCDGIIIANSSFHWWASWLGKVKETIAPLNWYVKPEWTAEDLYTENMILM